MPRGEKQSRERKAALVEIALPMVSVSVMFALALLLGDELRDRIPSMGWWFYAVSAAGISGLAGVCVLLWLARQGRNVPVALTIFVATLPWITGLGGMRFGMRMVDRALQHADWSMHGIMALRGYAEASSSAWFGLLFSCGLLASTAVVIAVRANGDRGQTLIALGVGCGVIACVGPALAVATAPIAALVALAAVVAAVSFGLSAGRPSAFGSVAAGFLATTAACGVAQLEGRIPGFGVVASVDAESRTQIFETIAEIETALLQASSIAIAAVGVGALVLCGESLRRTPVLRAVSVVVVVLITLALHRVSTAASMSMIEGWTDHAWPEDLEFARTPDEYASEPWLVVLENEEVWFQGEPVDDVVAKVRAEQRRRHEDRAREFEEYGYPPGYIHEEEPEWLEPEDNANRHAIGRPPDEESEMTRRFQRASMRPTEEIEGCPIGGGEEVAAVVDARLKAHALPELFGELATVELVGRYREARPLPDTEPLTILSNIALRDSLTQFSVWWPRTQCEPNALHDVLLTVQLSADRVREVRDFETGETLAFPDGLEQRRDDQPNAYFILFVESTGDASVQDLADLAAPLQALTGKYRLVLVDELPERIVVPLPAEIAESVAEQQLTFGPPRERAELRHRMSDSRELLDQCARRALSLDPELAGTMSIYFRVAPSGEVSSARTIGGAVELRALRGCLADAVKQWRFRPNDHEQRFSFWVRLGESRRE